MNSYDVIVGSNNETGELELDRIISITSKYTTNIWLIQVLSVSIMASVRIWRSL